MAALCAVIVALIGLGIPGCERSDEGAEATTGTGSEAGAAAERTGEGPDESTGEGAGEGAGEDATDEAKSNSEPSIIASETLPDSPKRIVSLAPNVTETLFALGVGDRVVAVTNFCDYPEEVEELPSIGTFSNPDFETILARQPDLVLGVISGGDKSVADKLDNAGVPYAFLRMYTVEETLRGLERIAELVGRPEEGDTMVETLREEMEAIAEEHGAGGSAPADAPDVLLVYGHDPLVAAGPGTFGHQLLGRAGGHNVLAGSDNKFPRLDMEKVLELQPDRILDTSMVSDEEARAFWEGHSALEAVQNDAVVHLNDPVVMRPGPRIDHALRRVAGAIHGTDGHGPDEHGEGGSPQ